MIGKYLPQWIDVTMKKESSTRLPIVVIEVSHVLNELFCQYLLSQSYSYSLGTAAVADGADSQLLSPLLNQLIERKECILNVKKSFAVEQDKEQAMVSDVEKTSTFINQYDQELLQLKGLLEYHYWEGMYGKCKLK